MRWSTQIGRIAGIPVRVHWTMALLLLLYSWGSGLGGLVATSISLVLLFASVLAHELSHAMAARWFGIGTSEILLLPIGGLAKIEQEPRSGRQEIAIAVAGPVMSLLLAGVAALGVLLAPSPGLLHSVASMLLSANLMLGLFNLVPAFPLDGGRMLRGALRERRGLLAATRIAARAGRVLAVVMALAGLVWGSASLVLVAVFVWLAGRGEQAMVEARAAYGAYGSSPIAALDPWSGWRSPTARQQGLVRGFDPRARAVERPARRFVIQAGPFGYVIREI